MRLLRLPLLLGLLVALSACGGGEVVLDDEPVRVRAAVDSADVTPGRPFELVVEVDKRDDVTFELPDVGAGIQGLVIMDVRHASERMGDRELTRTTFKLKAPLSGTYLIPGVEAPWKTPDMQVGTAGTGPILIEAVRAAGEAGSGEETLRDLKPVRKPPPLLWPWLVGAALLLIALVAALLLLKGIRLSPPPEPPKPAHQLALEELAALLRSDLLRATDQGPFAYRVSAILRRYLEARYGFRAWRMTTPEVLRAMPPALASRRELEASIREVLEASDRVKFAGQPVSTDELQGWVRRATAVVQATRPQQDVLTDGATS